jgi:hypothetical protein
MAIDDYDFAEDMAPMKILAAGGIIFMVFICWMLWSQMSFCQTCSERYKVCQYFWEGKVYKFDPENTSLMENFSYDRFLFDDGYREQFLEP